MEEKWKNIPNFEDYQISNFGNFKKGNKILKKVKCKSGYEEIMITKHGKRTVFSTHRLVMELFGVSKSNFKHMDYEDLSKIDINKLQVNHIDENITNNRIDNLEWCTAKYNANYGNRNAKVKETHRKDFKSISQYTLDGKFIKAFECIMDAAREIKGDKTLISRVCNHKLNCQTAYGYIWKFN